MNEPLAPSQTAVVLLAAGRSARMGSAKNKLLAPWEGKPLVVHVVDRLLASRAAEVIVVVGHQGRAICRALGKRPVQAVENPDYAQGLSTSIRAALGRVDGYAGALFALADMPWVDSHHVDTLIAAFEEHGHRDICVPTYRNRSGNPVLWPACYLGAMRDLSGDRGAKPLLTRFRDAVREVPMDDAAVLVDLDTPADWASGTKHYWYVAEKRTETAPKS